MFSPTSIAWQLFFFFQRKGARELRKVKKRRPRYCFRQPRTPLASLEAQPAERSGRRDSIGGAFSVAAVSRTNVEQNSELGKKLLIGPGRPKSRRPSRQLAGRDGGANQSSELRHLARSVRRARQRRNPPLLAVLRVQFRYGRTAAGPASFATFDRRITEQATDGHIHAHHRPCHRATDCPAPSTIGRQPPLITTPAPSCIRPASTRKAHFSQRT